MKITRLKPQYLPTTMVIIVVLFVWVLSASGVATAFDFHNDSAHGNTGYGVNRKDIVPDPDHPDAYNKGECAHCHDIFNDSTCGENDRMRFCDQYFCVQCHQYPASSYQEDMPYQGCYSYKFGGDTTITCPSSVKSAFIFINQTTGQPALNCGSNKGSAHYLPDIDDFLQNRWGFDDTPDTINLCEGCHNPHKAQRHDYPVDGQGTSPISLPSTHDGNWDVYGANTTERMDSYAGTQVYLAPYYYNKTGLGKYEPDGGSQQYGTNMPNYVTFCTDCHNDSNDIYSTQLGRYLHKFDWDMEKHGRAAATDGNGYTDFWYPYYDNQSGNYVLSCTDCHDPHGSPNPFLIRPRINDRTASIPGGNGEWADLCENCHMHRSHSQDPPDYGPHYKIMQQGLCTPCHNMHQGVYEPCINCHYHGGSYSGYKTF
ncbi:MAG: hypothetical protein JRJ47_11455 [Deltaproteobacteria bacterium]|nr:hypothetical protein [Deltaproteobacteria bacterium]